MKKILKEAESSSSEIPEGRVTAAKSVSNTERLHPLFDVPIMCLIQSLWSET